MVQYKWVALSNTTLGTLMASIDMTIVLIALPSIFRGINIDPFTSFPVPALDNVRLQHRNRCATCHFWQTIRHLWPSKTLQFRLSQYSPLAQYCWLLTPNTGDAGAIELIVFRIIQGVGAAFLFTNSAAIITDAFPENERGKALGINQLAFLAGSLDWLGFRRCLSSL